MKPSMPLTFMICKPTSSSSIAKTEYGISLASLGDKPAVVSFNVTASVSLFIITGPNMRQFSSVTMAGNKFLPSFDGEVRVEAVKVIGNSFVHLHHSRCHIVNVCLKGPKIRQGGLRPPRETITLAP